MRTHRRFFCAQTLILAALASLLLTSSAHAAPIDPVGIKEAKDINSGDTAWMLTSSALVLMMTGPGLALFYSGLVRRKNVLATMMQSFVLMAVITVLWAVVGYSLAFDTACPFAGGFKFAFLQGVGEGPCEYAPTIPHTTWMVYQLMFAIITPALICGAYAERMKFSAMLIFSSLWLLVVYCPMAHMVWGKGGLFNWSLPGQMSIPALDFAGGTVVHISSGVSALICALVLGKRVGFGQTPMAPHSVVLSVIGAALLWVGWFGFNGGSALAASGLASSAFVATHFAAASAALGWMFAEWIKSGKPTVLGAISGAVAGLVVITPASGFVTPCAALVMGLLGGVICFIAATSIKHAFGYDDSLDAFGVHGVGGTIGAILTGVFATSTINSLIKVKDGPNYEGLIYGNAPQLGRQIVAAAITWVIAAVGSFVLLKIVDALVGLRVTEAEESQGLDLSQHGEAGYIMDEGAVGKVVQQPMTTIDEERDQPRPASAPPDGFRRFSVVIDGATPNELIQAWSGLCQTSAAPPSAEFKSVYPNLTTVQGNRFRFRAGEPTVISESLQRLFKNTLRNENIRAHVESA